MLGVLLAEGGQVGAGYQVLGFHPVDHDPAIMKNGLHPGLGCDGADVGLGRQS
jgi:hypothetical protein